MSTRFFIAYCSPNGSTRAVAQTLQHAFSDNGKSVTMLDLADTTAQAPFLESLAAAGPDACLCVGSPVYRDLAVPPVMQLIEKLPQASGVWSLPFVTWGTACSGVALWQMGKALMEKGYQIAAAAKVGALHSLMWGAAQPAGDGHPDADDKKIVQELANLLTNRLEAGDAAPVKLEMLDYQPEAVATAGKEKIKADRMIVPKTVDNDACTQCGLCESECPVGAIRLDPYPEYAGTCIDCFNCIRLCPENALQSGMPLEKMHTMIQQRIKSIDEKPLTRIFS